MKLTRTFSVGLIAALTAMPIAGAHAQQSKGWVGLVITTGIGQTDRTGSMVFNDYPIIESIEPGSPAERAGLMSGDVILSINSQDLRKNPVPPASMLEPGQKVVFRFRRNDTMKTASLLVEPRPAGNPQTIALSIIGSVPTAERERASAEASAARGVLRRASAPMIEISPLATPTARPSIGVAGALLTQLNDDLRDALSVKGNGVFVINVEIGTPAGESGLKSGDVILKADREPLDNPGELIRIMRASAENAVRLQIIRKRKPQTVTLRW